jgi:hypothetical protein
VKLLYEMLEDTVLFELSRRTNVLELIVPEFIVVLNVAVTLFDTDMRIALGTGLRDVTKGELGAAAVVNVQVTGLIALPARSSAPLSVAVYVVEFARLDDGVMVTRLVVRS